MQPCQRATRKLTLDPSCRYVRNQGRRGRRGVSRRAFVFRKWFLTNSSLDMNLNRKETLHGSVSQCVLDRTWHFSVRNRGQPSRDHLHGGGSRVQTSSAIDTTSINFDSSSLGYHGSLSFNLSGTLTASYSGTMFIESASQYGGAGGTGNYFSIQATQSTTLTLNESQAYFGMWLSAGRSRQSTRVLQREYVAFDFSTTSSEITSLPPSYLGNPNTPFLGQNGSEQYVFVNFYAQTAADEFNTIVFSNAAGATEFESDNHTFSETLQAGPCRNRRRSSWGAAAIAVFGLWRRFRRI